MKISVLLPYANPHNLDWIMKIPNVELNIGCISSTQNYRPGYFREYDSIEGVFYFFKSDLQKSNFLSQLKKSDVLITLGIFDKFLLSISNYVKKDIRLIVLSEPYNPINSKKNILLRKLWSSIIRYQYRNIDFFCIGGNAVKSYYTSLDFKKSRYYNFGFFPDISFSPPKVKNEDDYLTIGFVGQLIQRKGVDRLLELMRFLTKYNYPHKLLVAGEGEDKSRVLHEITSLENSNIIYVGLISEKEKLVLFLESLDILFIPSYFDGWGAVVNEAIAKSCAIVSSDKVFAALSMINDNGFTFSDDFTQVFERYFNDYSLLNGHMQNCKYIFEEWNPFNIAKEVYNLIALNDTKNNKVVKEI